MDLKSIISVSGMSGLYKIISHSRTGVIVEGLSDKKRTMISANHRINSLDSISVFTSDKDIPLEEVFVKMKEKLKAPVDIKAEDKLKAEFEKALPEYDKEKVRDSDIRKMLSWFNILSEYPDAWVEKKEEEGGTPGEVKTGIPLPSDRTKSHSSKDSGKVNTHGAGFSRSAIPQKKGGG